MRGSFFPALVALVPATAMATVPPPPIGNLNSGGKTSIVTFAAPPSRLACEGHEVAVIESAPFHPKAWQPRIPPVGSSTGSGPPKPVQTYTFSINADGAVTDIQRGSGFTPWSTDDHIATLASWRFAPGAAVKGCKLDLVPTETPLADTAPARLFELVASEGRDSPSPVREALAKAGDCYQPPRRAPDTLAYPDLRRFNDKSVSPPWAGVRYSIDAQGAVRDVKVVAQSGEAAFADAAASSIAESRFYPGTARTGCYATFSAKAKPTPAPARPDLKTFERPGDACDITREAMNTPENKTFPAAYAKRGVAGWAIVRFDVAPWGQIGNVEVLAAQPSDAFGMAARNLVQSARPSPPATGYRGCLVPILYAIPAPIDDLD